MEDLERILINIQDKKVGKLIVVDGVFSMEGDLAARYSDVTRGFL